MQDIYKSIKAALYERATSPLAGAFLISWFVWNYQLLLIVLSSEPIVLKLSMLDQRTEFFSSFTSTYFWRGVFYPLVTTFFFIYIYPLAAKKVYGHTLKNRNDLLKLKYGKDEEALSSPEQRKVLLESIEKLKSEHSSEVKELYQYIDVLRASVKDEQKLGFDISKLPPAPDGPKITYD